MGRWELPDQLAQQQPAQPTQPEQATQGLERGVENVDQHLAEPTTSQLFNMYNKSGSSRMNRHQYRAFLEDVGVSVDELQSPAADSGSDDSESDWWTAQCEFLIRSLPEDEQYA